MVLPSVYVVEPVAGAVMLNDLTVYVVVVVVAVASVERFLESLFAVSVERSLGLGDSEGAAAITSLTTRGAGRSQSNEW